LEIHGNVLEIGFFWGQITVFLTPKPTLAADSYGKGKETLSSGTECVKSALGTPAKGRRLTEAGKGFQLREAREPYGRHFGVKN